ncbi:MAG: MerR family transcriptional regulator [Chromatiales bacterium]|nr:MerR family transcriptional regulator [Gammaproteobacteria bacterium]
MNEVKQPSDDNITIGSLAKAAGVNVETIRNYQRIGLVDEPDKPAQGYRHYLASVIDRIQFIKRTQDPGFTLKEITHPSVTSSAAKTSWTPVLHNHDRSQSHHTSSCTPAHQRSHSRCWAESQF